MAPGTTRQEPCDENLERLELELELELELGIGPVCRLARWRTDFGRGVRERVVAPSRRHVGCATCRSG